MHLFAFFCVFFFVSKKIYSNLWYLCIVVVNILLSTVCWISLVLFAWIECIDDYLLSTFDFCSTEWTALLVKWKKKNLIFDFFMNILSNLQEVGMDWNNDEFTCPSESTCHAVRHGVHNKWPHGSIRMSLSFSAHILHNWNVLPETQSLNRTKEKKKHQNYYSYLTWFVNIARQLGPPHAHPLTHFTI